jgi:cysteinyl-tRNA synthetase
VALVLYNTLSRRRETFTPRDPGRVAMYTCGPTVYDYTHIGHLRPALVADVLKRYLVRAGYRVYHVTNFTDVDDRIIARAQREGSSPEEVAGRYIEDYLRSMRALGVDQVDLYVRVTEHVPDIVAMIAALVEGGYAYPVDGDVYFAVTRKGDYGKLSGRSLDQMQAGARVQVDPRKQHPMDFALWKAARPGEPSWPSPWGPGRPGWHIECSALGLRYLGNHFDIHGGGDDLIFPHHENEIAQSEAFTAQPPFVRFWVHNGMIQVSDEKMSKSLGNFVPLHDLLRSHPAPSVRHLLLTTHYRKPLNYSESALDEAARGWRRLQATRDRLGVLLHGATAGQGAGRTARGEAAVTPDVDTEVVDDGWAAPPPGSASVGARPGAPALRDAAAEALKAWEAAMDDDLNTAGALAALFDLTRAANAVLAGVGSDLDAETRAALAAADRALDDMGSVLGLWRREAAAGPAGDSDDLVAGLVQLLLQLRQDARRARDWAAADRIRGGLADLGLSVEDTPQGTRWTRR